MTLSDITENSKDEESGNEVKERLKVLISLSFTAGSRSMCLKLNVDLRKTLAFLIFYNLFL